MLRNASNILNNLLKTVLLFSGEFGFKLFLDSPPLECWCLTSARFAL
jgi:hypothetical protein